MLDCKGARSFTGDFMPNRDEVSTGLCIFMLIDCKGTRSFTGDFIPLKLAAALEDILIFSMIEFNQLA